MLPSVSYLTDDDGTFRQATPEEQRRYMNSVIHKKRELNRYLLSEKRRSRGYKKAKRYKRRLTRPTFPVWEQWALAI